MALRSTVLMVGLCLVGCTVGERPAPPSVTSVEPAVGFSGEVVPVTVHGASFFVRGTHSIGKPSSVDSTFSARLGDIALEDVTFVDERTLTARVPQGVPPGRYALVVEGPYGRSEALPEAYASWPVKPGEEATLLADDPFRDGATSTSVLAHGGKVYLGPNRSGTGGARLEADGSALESTTFAFLQDSGSLDASANTSAAPYPSLGAPSCALNTSACGPDNEDARGRLFSGSVAGTSWVVFESGKSTGDASYVYVTSDLGPAMTARYLDLSLILFGTSRRAFVSGHFWHDRLYLGLSDTTDAVVAVLTVMPLSVPGLDVLMEGNSLGLSVMPGIGRPGGGTAMVDQIADFNDRLYVMNAGAWVRSTNNDPGAYVRAPSDWTVATPSAAAYTGIPSRRTDKTSGLDPADRAVPQMATFGGRLFVARNTTLGPQLWACEPARTGDSSGCDPGDWALVAPNGLGDARLSQFDNPSNTAISMLVATPTDLYVGYDNANQGVVVFRTRNPRASSRADFLGALDCAADQHPGACAGFGGEGFGKPTNTRIFDAAALTFGAEAHPYLVVGDGVVPLRLYRLWP